MSTRTPSREPAVERDEWWRCGLEPSFQVITPDEPECQPARLLGTPPDSRERWAVMDAECVVLAWCPSEEHANIVCRAMERYAARVAAMPE